MMLLFPLVAAVPSERGHDPVLASRVESASVAVGRLAHASGRRFEVSVELGRIPVLVDIITLSPEKTLSLLAFALHGSLVRDGDSLRIERTAHDRQVFRASRLAANREIVETALTKWDRVLKRADAIGGPAAQVRKAREETSRIALEAHAAGVAHQPFTVPADLLGEYMVRPDARLLRGLLARVGPDRLADFEPGGVRYLSDKPRGVEGPMPPCADLIDAYDRAQSQYANAMDLPSPEGASTKAIVDFDAVGAGVSIFDARGRRLGGVGENYLMRALIAGSPVPSSSPSTPIDLDEPSRRMATLLRNERAELRREDLPETYLRPERFDPLGFSVRQGLLALPRAPKSAGLVAALSDEPLGPTWSFLRDGRLDVQAFASRLFGEGGFERVDQGGATVIRPIDPLRAETHMADRETLGREIRRVVAARDLSLPSWCRLQATLYPGSEASARYLWPLSNLGLRTFPGVRNQAWPGVCALIGFAQEGSSSADSRRLETLVREGIVHRWLRFDGPPGTSDLDRAPSTVLASLEGFRIVPTGSETSVARAYGAAGDEFLKTGFGFAQEADALGEASVALWLPQLRQGTMTRSEVEGIADQKIRGSHYQLGRRIALGADVLLANGMRAHVEEKDWVADRDGLSFGDLPAPFQEAILRGARRTIDGPSSPSMLPRTGSPAGV